MPSHRLTRPLPLALALSALALLAPGAARASDDEIRQAVTQSAATVAAQEAKVQRASNRYLDRRRPSRKAVDAFRSAARGEARALRRIGRELTALTADTPPVAAGRDQIVAGLRAVARALDRIEAALGRQRRGGSATSVRRSVAKALRGIVVGNESIERGELSAGVELTPKPTPEPTPAAPAPASPAPAT